MTVYRMNPDAYQEARRTLRRRTLVIGLSLALIVSVLITVFQQSDEPLSAQTYATIFVFFFAIFGGGTVLITLLSGRRFDAAWRAFELTLDGDSLTVRQLGMNPISVQRSEVTSINR
jgi:peptidoglycan/LPS O-acetylase OafA/YrhL